MNSNIESLSERDLVEKLLISSFNGVVKPMNLDDIPLIDTFKDGTFGFSYLGIMLYANGRNIRGKSTIYKNGLLYFDGENVFGIGFFRKTISEPSGHLFIIAPRGNTWLDAVNSFICRVRQIDGIPPTTTYLRYLTKQQYESLLELDYEQVELDPWHPDAHSEDETYCHSLVKLDDILIADSDKNVSIKKLDGVEDRNFRVKAKREFDRFGHFLSRNNFSLAIEPFSHESQISVANDIIVHSFSYIKQTVGSSPEDYFNLSDSVPSLANNPHIYARIGYLINDNNRIPVMLFIGEMIDSETMAIYASFALRKHKDILQHYNSVGYTAISRYCHLRVFQELYQAGVKFVNLGGAETSDLDRFKQYLGAKEKSTYWALAR